MSIERIGITLPPAPAASRCVIHGDRIYLGGIRAAGEGLDIAAQTRAALARVESSLAEAGSDKSKILTVQIWLADMTLFAAMNVVWNEWVDAERPPLRACVRAELSEPGALVEFLVTAVR